MRFSIATWALVPTADPRARAHRLDGARAARRARLRHRRASSAVRHPRPGATGYPPPDAVADEYQIVLHVTASDLPVQVGLVGQLLYQGLPLADRWVSMQGTGAPTVCATGRA